MRRLVTVGALLLLAACGQSDPPPTQDPTPSPNASQTTLTGPEAAVSRLMRALEDGDCDTAQGLVLTPSELGCDLIEQSEGSFEAEGIDLTEATYRAGARHDDSIVVTIRWNDDLPKESYDVQRVKGQWKVVFDSAA